MSDTSSSDTFTETTSTSWFRRIGESIKGVLVGLALVAASVAALFWNEGRAVQTARSLTEGAGLVVSADVNRVDPANEGKLVHVSGDLKAGSPLGDPEFTVTASEVVRLTRTAEMYQWKEESKTETKTTVGGTEEKVTTYNYVRVWSDKPINSADFKRPDGHTNPQMRYGAYSATTKDATLGAFKPSERVVGYLSARDALPVDAAVAQRVRDKTRGPAQIENGRLYLGADPGTPRIGDYRITYQVAKNGPVSVVGRQTGSDFTDFQTQAGDKLLMVRPGTITAADMFTAAQRENTILTWIIRAVGALIMFVGFALVLRPLVVVADVIPLFGQILGAGASLVALMLTAILAPVVIAIAWFWYRPLVSVIVLVVGLAAAFGLRQLAAKRAATRAATAPAPA